MSEADKQKESSKEEKIIELLQIFILKRGWRLKIAKRDPLEQSLFIHSMNELGAIQNYLLLWSHPFNESEILKLYIASITHDCEKETDNWQRAIYHGEKPPHHTDPNYAKKFVSEVMLFLKENKIDFSFNERDINDIISSQPLHMKAAANKPSKVFEEISREHHSERWSEIATLIDLFDDLISTESIEAAIDILKNDDYRMLNERLEFNYHKINKIRGILSALLHKSCEQYYAQQGFIPFLYYVDGTLYFRKRELIQEKETDPDEIKVQLSLIIDDFLSKIDIELENDAVIGRPQTTMILMPEFFRKESIEKYFISIQKRYKNTRKKVDKNKLKEVVETRYNTISSAKRELNFEQLSDGEFLDKLVSEYKSIFRDDSAFSSEIQLIIDSSYSRPQQYMFQFFKEITHKILKNEENFQIGIKQDYDTQFGAGAYEKLQKKSITKPLEDFKLFIKPYWQIQIDANEKKIGELSCDEQENYLIKNLSSILKKNIDKCVTLPKDEFFKTVSNSLISSDLSYPVVYERNENVSFDLTQDIFNRADKEIKNIGDSKEKLFNETKGVRLCPLCHNLMSSPNFLRADILSDEQGIAKVFNNQTIGTSGFQKSVNICILCHSELLLRRILLGKTPSDLVLLFPSLNFAKLDGKNLLENLKSLQDNLEQFYCYNNPDLNIRVEFNNLRILTTNILEKNLEEISAELNPQKFIESFRVKISKDTKKNDIRKIEEKITELYDANLDDFNKEYHTNYSEFKKIAEDLFEGNCVFIPETERGSIIESANVNTIRYSLIFKTPNFIVISLPMAFSFDKDEADVNISLKRLLFALYLYLLTDCSVMVIPAKEIIHVPQKRNAIYVQPNATLKTIIKDNWISIQDVEKWIIAISAAIKLAYEGEYSERSGIYEVLTQRTVGHIIHRISSKKTITSNHINMVEKLKHTGVMRNEAAVNTEI